MAQPIAVRTAGLDEIPAIVDLAGRALGWDPSDPNDAFFRWKHLENPAGPSPMWVATAGDDLAGFRTMMRWTFVDGDRRVSAVRAVDTATAPEHQRRGVFRLLAGAAVDELIDRHTDFVFNTPNDKSRPGYLSMGWIEAGRIPARVLPAGLGALPRLAQARTAAAKWSEPLDAGDPVDTVADDLAFPAADGIRTDRTAAYLRWRYGFEPLHYRVVQTDDAAAVVRVRHRGPAREAVIADVTSASVQATRRVLRVVRRLRGVDHLLSVADPPHPASWWPSAPGLGPVLTTRDLAGRAPSRAELRLSLGDIELF
ncbi:MAG: GNAT family N-acetyltransferase [Actinomycetota bacterium]